MIWQLSDRADPECLPLADRHYNRQHVGSPQFVPPGRCVVLKTDGAVWVTSWPFAEYVKHDWPGAWINSLFGMQVAWFAVHAERPTGQQFLGACLVEVVAAEADEAADQIAIMFPFAQPNAEWIGAATKKAHQLGCNPGGEVLSVEIPADHPNLSQYQFGVLMDRTTIEHLDQLLAPGDPEGR